MSRRVGLWGLLTLGLGVQLLAVPASAETAVLMPHNGDERLQEARDEARMILGRALRSQGIAVIEHGDASKKLAETSGEGCHTVDCAASLLGAVSADFAAAVAVWSEPNKLAPSTVFVTLVDGKGARYPGKSAVDPGDLRAATTAALLDARALQLLGPGPWLRVRGGPEGAEVHVDGTRVGTLPYRAPMQPGRYRLEVRAADHRPHIQTVDVPPNKARQVEVRVDMVPRDGNPMDSNADPSPAADPAGPSILGPAIVGGAGLLIVGVDIAYVLNSGCERREATGRCTRDEETSTTAAVAWGGVGIAAIGAAIVWYLLDAQTGEEDPSMVVTPQGVALSGRF